MLFGESLMSDIIGSNFMNIRLVVGMSLYFCIYSNVEI